VRSKRKTTVREQKWKSHAIPNDLRRHIKGEFMKTCNKFKGGKGEPSIVRRGKHICLSSVTEILYRGKPYLRGALNEEEAPQI